MLREYKSWLRFRADQAACRHARGASRIAALLIALQPLGSAAEESATSGIPDQSIATSLPYNGDPYGRRKALAERGITYSFMYTNDVLANVDGGRKRGVVDQGKLEGTLSVDLDKLTGLKGLSFFANAFQIHNTGRIRRDYVDGINTIAAIEALSTTRLSEFWLEQKLANDKASIRFGQLAADVEFFFSGLSVLFLQSDWPTIAAANLPSGGPAYPLATPGIRIKFDPTPNYTLLFALFNGDPAGPGEGDEQQRNRYGLNFRVQDSPLYLGELQWRTNQKKEDTGLATTIKVGAWGHVGHFNDERFADDGTLIANPAGSGMPMRHWGNGGIYGIIDQQLYRPPGGDATSGVSVFGRFSASPSDRSLISFYVDSGIVVAGLIPGRPDDQFGAAVIYSEFSNHVGAADRDGALYSGVDGPIRDFEANLELTYSAQIIPGWTVQPMFTRIWHPAGDASRDATVVGVRSFLRY
jgi:porin